jgi:branched-chain amino acid transport system substrate-binding protein
MALPAAQQATCLSPGGEKGAKGMKAQRWTSTLSKPILPAVLLIVLAVGCLWGCVGKESIPVGFVAQLTGVQAELGVQERNGVQLAVEEINAAGGVAGRPIRLVVRDDRGTSEGARAADRELIDAGVVAIIGHATSEQTMAGLSVTDPAGVVMVSPTASSPKLSSREDFFFRVVYSLADRAHVLADHIYQGRGIKRIAIICDADNAAYTKTYQESFADRYRSLGGKLTMETDFSSKAQPDFTLLVERLHASNPDGLLIVAADIDTALIAQRTRLMGWSVPLFASSWAQTETLVTNGGRAVEGLELEIASAVESQTRDYLGFKRRYQSRFGQAHSFGAVLGYEAAQILAAALQKTRGTADGLPEALVGIRNFKGLTDTLSFDRYGDIMRPYYLGVIRDGKYAVLGAYEPEED